MLNTVTSADALSDLDLVADALRGRREAFGAIVDRYKSLVCSIAYSATGDLAQSEDLAQETFIAAWKNLRHLREPARLRSWLCGIARNTINNSLRRQEREPSHRAEDLDALIATPDPGPLPADRAISAEEQSLLWRALEQIPDTYREPLVLFYREGESVENVARALEISEDAVKQRLSRGRKFLSEQLSVFVEGALRQSVPGRAFTFAVLAALPTLPMTASAAALAAAGTTAAQGSAAAKALTFTAILGAILGPLAGALGAWIGIKSSLDNAQSEAERSLIKRQVRNGLIFVGTFLALVFAVISSDFLKARPALFATVNIVMWTTYTFALFLLIYRHNARWRRRRETEASTSSRESNGARPRPRESFEYRSAWTFLGLPLVHVCTGHQPGGRPSIARGWIAIGDVAFGLLAFGGIAGGGFAFGGMAFGAFGLGGLAIGIFAFGGLGFGCWVAAGIGAGIYAMGGVAMAWKVAVGGVAVAHDIALGGIASAPHANDALARAAQHTWFFNLAKFLTEYAILLIWMPIALVVWQAYRMKRKKRLST